MQECCGVVLAGGWGTRLLPLTTSLNKHLLPVYDEPMIFKSLSSLQRMGIKDDDDSSWRAFWKFIFPSFWVMGTDLE